MTLKGQTSTFFIGLTFSYLKNHNIKMQGKKKLSIKTMMWNKFFCVI